MDLVIGMLIAIGTAIAGALGTVGVSSVVRARQMRREPLREAARQAVIVALCGEGSMTGEALTRLGQLPRRDVARVLLDLAPSVNGTSRQVLLSLGEDSGLLRRAHKGVRHRRWATRLYSARVLTAFGVDSEDMWLLLRDRSPEVRAQAAAWATIAPSPSTIQRLITLLSDGNGLCRFTAQDALIRIGLGGSDALISALETANDDLKEKILIIAAATGDERFYGPAAQLAWDQSPRTRQLAAAVLASTGRSNAGQILVILLDDPSNAVVLAALVGLAKLSYWPAAATVERLLHHASWELRHQAGVTLMALGAPGIVMLRATARDEGPAAEMAERVLQLQALAIGSEAA